MCCLIATEFGRAFRCKTKEKNNLVHLSKTDFGLKKQGKMYAKDGITQLSLKLLSWHHSVTDPIWTSDVSITQ